jgi:hypothetical protein
VCREFVGISQCSIREDSQLGNSDSDRGGVKDCSQKKKREVPSRFPTGSKQCGVEVEWSGVVMLWCGVVCGVVWCGVVWCR